MRVKYLFLITAITYAQIIFGQAPVLDTTYSQPLFNYGTSVSVISDASYLLVGTANDVSNGYDIVISKADNSGNIIWQNYYGDPNIHEFGFSVYKQNSNAYVIAGSVSWAQAFILKIDSSGTQLSYDTLSSVYGSGLEITETFDHNYAILTNKGIVKIDPSGNVLWSKNYETLLTPSQFVQTPDSGFAIIGDTLQTLGSFVLLKTNSSGDSLWAKSYGGPNPDDTGITINNCSDGGFIIGGAYDSGLIGTIFPFAYLIRTNSTGDTLWTNIDQFSLGEDEVIHVLETSDGGFVYSGSHVFQDFWGTYFLDMRLRKCDSTGITVPGWGSVFQDATIYMPVRNFQQTLNNGFVLYCTREYPPNFLIPANMRLIITDSLGHIVTGIPENESETENPFKISPNPSNGKFNIVFGQLIDKGELVIYNCFGELIYKENLINESVKEVNLIITASGIYFVKISCGEKSYCGKMAIEQD